MGEAVQVEVGVGVEVEHRQRQQQQTEGTVERSIDESAYVRRLTRETTLDGGVGQRNDDS